MSYEELLYFLQHVGKDPSRLIFEDELTGLYNRRFLLNYFQYKVNWDALDEKPISLVMVDVDHFKKINDRFGHNLGDQALTWVAGVLREVAGDKGMPVRYAGDEFMILLPQGDKRTAMQAGKRLLQRLREEPFRLGGGDESLDITVSIGVASAPEDAKNGKDLIHKADKALYFAKKAGRGRLAEAEEIPPQEVFAKTALYHLDSTKISGRGPQLAVVGKALRKFSKGQSQFLIFEGGPGMGKSEFLETVSDNLARSKMQQVKVSGMPQELFRPYYLVTNILAELLKQRQDKGEEVLESLSPKEIVYLSYILPQLGGESDVLAQKGERALRQGIFITLTHFFLKVLDYRPVIIYIDDLHLSDVASLIVLRELILRQEIPLCLYTTSIEIRQLVEQVESVPIVGFYGAYAEELDIRKVCLTPLKASDIAEHLQKIFPHMSWPDNFPKDLTQVSQGNPLFLAEILRKLIIDQKVSLIGQQWVVEPLEEGYLPRSLEEIVSQKITALDEEGKQLLDQASVLGENFSLSFLIGSSEKMEAEVLEFVEKAVAQGLIRSDFQINDEVIRFLGKRVLEITYGAIQQDRKQELHERIGNYQETLFKQGLLSSAVTLAYHFQRSANQEKVEKYGRFQAEIDTKIFDIFEALEYTGDEQIETSPEDVPLDPASLASIPKLIRLLLTAVRNVKMYPPGSNTIVKATQQLKETIDRILVDNDRLNINHVNHELMVNGEPVDITEFKPFAEAFFKCLGDIELRGISFSRGLTEHELKVMLEGLSRASPKMIDHIFWQRFSAEQRLIHIGFKQVHYTEMEDPEAQARVREKPGEYGRTIPMEDSYMGVFDESRLDLSDLAQIHSVMRCLVTAVSNKKFYPSDSKVIADSLTQLMEVLNNILSERPVLAFTSVGSSILVNGNKVDTADFKQVADSFLELLETVNLKSLTFLKHISLDELRSFIGALGELPADGLDDRFWRLFARDKGLTRILFNQHLYEILMEQIGMGTAIGQSAEGQFEGIDQVSGRITPTSEDDLPTEAFTVSDDDYTQPEAEQADPAAEDFADDSLEEISGRIKDLLLKGDEEKIYRILHRLFQGFGSHAPEHRRKVIHICRDLLEELSRALEHRFAKLLADPLMGALSDESNPDVLEETATLLHHIATNLIEFVEYALASRIFLHLHQVHRELEGAEHEHAQRLAMLLNREPDRITQELLMENLTSDEPSRQQDAVQLLSNMGRAAIPILIDSIKGEEKLTVRKLAANLLKELGPEAVKLLKDQLVLGTSAEERLRVLEVIATATCDLHTEFACALGDEDHRVRQAAFRLAEHMKDDDQVVEILLDHGQNGEVELAVSAIRCLGKLRSAAAKKALLSMLNSSKETKRLVACCRALGEIGEPASIEALAKLLEPGKLLSLRRKRSELLRATAAFALARIDHPQAKEVLAAFVDDPEPRVRRIARKLLNSEERGHIQQRAGGGEQG